MERKIQNRGELACFCYFALRRGGPTDDEEHDRHGDTDDDDPRLDILQPGSPLRSPRSFLELVPGHIETIARLLQILQSVTAVHHFLHVIPHYVRHLLNL